jgi:hypothetical protein
VFNVKTRAVASPASSTNQTAGLADEGTRSHVDQYPLIFTVTSAMRRTGKTGTTTTGVGVLTSKDEASKPAQQINFECDTGVYSRTGNNVYPARASKPYQLKIEARELGSNKAHEFTCKY